MKIEVFTDVYSVARQAAALIAAEARAAVAARDRFVMAVSGGHAASIMLTALAQENIPWAKILIAQVDERILPVRHFERNLTRLRGSLLDNAPLPSKQIYPMPVEALDLEAAARQYAATLAKLSGSLPVFDLIHLGLGPEGRTASLVPGDPILEISEADVGITEVYQKSRRMTLTYPILNRARRILWLVTGSEKTGMLDCLLKADTSIPAGRVNQARAVVFADRAAAKNVHLGVKDYERQRNESTEPSGLHPDSPTRRVARPAVLGTEALGELNKNKEQNLPTSSVTEYGLLSPR
jgi:6-phosphogluconolactonase